MQVLALDSDNADDQVDALTQTLRARVRALSSWSLGSSTTSLSMVTAALKCPSRPDPDCAQRMGDELKADRVMYGWINKSGPHEVTAEVHMWARGQREVVTTEKYSDALVNANDPRLNTVADRILEKLLGETPTPPPKVEVKKEQEQKAPSHGASARTVIGWTAIGLGVAAGVFGTIEGVHFLSLQSDNKNDAKNPGGNFCDGGASGNATACDRFNDGKTARTLELVSFGVGAALIGTGVVLLLTDHSGERDASTARKWQLSPEVGPRSGRVDLRVTF